MSQSSYTVQATKRYKELAVEIYAPARKSKAAIRLKFQTKELACSTMTLQDFKKITDETPQPTNSLYDHSVIHPIGST